MGTLFSAFDIGRSGLQVAQVQLDVTAHNIANVNKEGFSRQRVELTTRRPVNLGFGQVGRGVQVGRITRLRAEFLDFSYRRQNHELGRSEIETRAYQLVEDLLLEPTEQGFGSRLSQFFTAATAFANSVESIPARQAFLSEAQALADGLNQLTSQISNLRTDANAQVKSIVSEINGISGRIDQLNKSIAAQEVGGAVASELRDERDLQLDRLSRLVKVNYREVEDGTINVFIGTSELVSSSGAREISAVVNSSLDPERPDLVEVRDTTTNILIDIQGGELRGALNVRDVVLTDIDNQLDTLAAGLIQQANTIHTQGNGLNNYSDPILSSNRVSNAATPLVSAGLPFPVTPGTIDVVVYDNTGTPTTTTVSITNTTTLNDLATALSGIPGFTASVTVDGNLQVDSQAGFTYSFANDSAGLLPALGVNVLFTGSDARSIGVNQDLINDPALLTSGYSTNPLDTGDNEAALALANIQQSLFYSGGTATIGEFYENFITETGVNARTESQTFDAQTTLVDNFEVRRQEVSGVSIDEEVTFLLQFQRAFEASSRVISTVDRMLETLLNTAL